MSNLILTSTVLKAKKKIAVITMADTGYNTNILNVVNRYGLSVTDMFRLSYALLIQYL